MKGTLFLIPTPIDDTSPLEPVAKNMLEQAIKNDDIICVEEIKEGRRRWLRFGLEREAIEDFVLYNEHTRKTECDVLIQKLKSGKNVFLMSDCGLPAFCDPGQDIVNRCHELNIKVTSTPFPNSIALALALSGIDHSRFVFEGFISAKKDERLKELRRISKSPMVSILMDTPYRMKSLLEDLSELAPNRDSFLALELNKEGERLIRGRLSKINEMIKKDKKEFILILG